MLRLPLQVFLSRERGNVRLRSASFVSHGHNEKHFEETPWDFLLLRKTGKNFASCWLFIIAKTFYCWNPDRCLLGWDARSPNSSIILDGRLPYFSGI